MNINQEIDTVNALLQMVGIPINVQQPINPGIDSHDQLVEFVKFFVPKVMVAEQEMYPTWIIMFDGHTSVATSPWQNDRQKFRVIHTMRNIMKDQKAVGYAMISEAWMATETMPPNLTEEQRLEHMRNHDGPMPSERPDRVEVVFCKTHTKEKGPQFLKWLTIRDKAGKVIRLDEQEMDDARAHFGNFDDLLKD